MSATAGNGMTIRSFASFGTYVFAFLVSETDHLNIKATIVVNNDIFDSDALLSVAATTFSEHIAFVLLVFLVFLVFLVEIRLMLGFSLVRMTLMMVVFPLVFLSELSICHFCASSRKEDCTGSRNSNDNGGGLHDDEGCVVFLRIIILL